jgi:chorismate mutase
VDTADRAPSKLGDLPVSIDNIDAAIVHMLAERFNVRRGTAERRASGVYRRTVEKEPCQRFVRP